MRFLLFILTFLIYDATCSTEENGWRGNDLCVTHYPLWQRPAQVLLKAKAIVVNEDDTSSLFETLEEEMLAGYNFSPDVPAHMRVNPALRQSGVREIVCSRCSFTSPVIRNCFTSESSEACTIEHCLAQSGCDGKRPSAAGRRGLLVTDVKEKIFPEDKTRLWSVVSAKHVGAMAMHERVVITFRGRKDALEGVLCDRALESEGLSDEKRCSAFEEGNLLAIARRGHVSSETTVERPVGVLQTANPLDRFFVEGYNIGFIYPCDNQWGGVLLSSEGLFRRVRYCYDCEEDCMRVPLDCALTREFNRGFFLKGPYMDVRRSNKKVATLMLCQCDTPHVEPNYAVLSQQDVRTFACRRKAFCSEVLLNFVRSLPKKWEQRCVSEQTPWREASQESLRALASKNKKLSWTIWDEQEFTSALEMAPKKGTMFLLVRGENVVLRGKQTVNSGYPGKSIGTLWELLSKDLLLSAEAKA